MSFLLKRSFSASPFKKSNIAEIMQKYGALLEAQECVHHVFYATNEINVLVYEKNEFIPKSIEDITVNQYISSDFVSSSQSFKIDEKVNNGNELSDYTTLNRNAFESLFLNKHGIHSIFHGNDFVNVIGTEEKAIEFLPEYIDYGKTRINYYQGFPFVGASNTRNCSSKAAIVSYKHGIVKGSVGTLGCPVTPSQYHPKIKELNRLMNIGKSFVTIAGHTVLHGVRDLQVLGNYYFPWLHRKKYLSGRVHTTIENAKSNKNKVGFPIQAYVTQGMDCSILAIDKDKRSLLRVPDFVKGFRELKIDDNLQKEQFYAILSNEVVPVMWFGGRHEGPSFTYCPWGINYPRVTLNTAYSFSSNDFAGFYGPGDSGAIIVDENNKVVASSISRSFCSTQKQEIFHPIGVTPPEKGNVIIGHPISVCNHLHWDCEITSV